MYQYLTKSGGDLPLQDDLYAGRQEETQTIISQLCGPTGCRVVSLVAGGGLGKSSLALDVAQKMLYGGKLNGACVPQASTNCQDL